MSVTGKRLKNTVCKIFCKSKKGIINDSDLQKLEDVDAILVLGCKVNENYTPSLMLENRLKKGVIAYNLVDTKLILSGDHGQVNYDEVNTMKKYIEQQDINLDNVFLDHAGFSTYDSIYRAKYVFGAKKIVIVSQNYHLYRALYIANSLGIEAYGLSADNIPFPYVNIKNEIREVLARNKDLYKTIIMPSSKYVGDPIDLNGSGKVTFD